MFAKRSSESCLGGIYPERSRGTNEGKITTNKIIDKTTYNLKLAEGLELLFPAMTKLCQN